VDFALHRKSKIYLKECTQNIEKLWREMHVNISRFGTRKYHYEYYIVEFFKLFKRLYTFLKYIDVFL